MCRPGLVLVPFPGGHVIRLQEKGLAAKLELLFTKSLYPIALNMARFEQVCCTARFCSTLACAWLVLW